MKRSFVARVGILLPLVLGVYLCQVVPVRAEQRSYVFVPEESKLYVQVFKDESTLASGLAHNHVVLATGWRGRVYADPEDLARCVLEVTVPVDGLQPDLPAMRTLVGYKGTLSDSDRKSVAKEIRGRKQLDAKRFPEITFRSRSCSGTRDEVVVNGELTIRGQSKVVAIRLRVFHSDALFRAEGMFTAQHSDFGFSPYSAFFGVVKNRPEIKFVIDVVAKPE